MHKCQGQTFSGRVGISLKTPSFTHGHLYTACSRVTDPKNLFIELPDCENNLERKYVTANVVYPKIIGNT